MRNPERISVFLKYLSKVWEEYPDLRFSQLYSFVKTKENDFYEEDKYMFYKILKILYPVQGVFAIPKEELRLFEEDYYKK